jgi:hypothetical protein
MKKNSTTYAIKMLGFTLIVLMAILKPAFSQMPAPDFDMPRITMTVSPDQQVKLRLPKDIRSGDQITGTVIEEKKSVTAANNNSSSTLEGVVIEIDGKQTKLSNRFISFIVPAGVTSLPFLLKNAAGEILDRGQIPVNGPMYDLLSDLWWREPLGGLPCVEPMGQPGQALRITGPFDGDASNTKVSLNNLPCEIIAESNRMTYLQVPQNAAAGVSTISIEENKIITERKLNIVELALRANKTTLLKGEKATITVKVNGLESFDLTKNNIKLQLVNQSPQTISFAKESSNTITKDLKAGPVNNGIYEFSTKVVSLAKGTFKMTADLMGEQNDCIKRYQSAMEQMKILRADELKRCEKTGGDINACKSAVNKMIDGKEKELYDVFVRCMTGN